MVSVSNRGHWLTSFFEAWMGGENKVQYLVFPCGKIKQLQSSSLTHHRPYS